MKRKECMRRRFLRANGRLTKWLQLSGTLPVEPTNNVAEQALRHCVVDLKVTQGTRGEAGKRWCEPV